MAFTRCILFTRYTREQNTTCKGHLAFQKVIYSRESAIHSFSYPNIHSFYYECRKGTFFQKEIFDVPNLNYYRTSCHTVTPSLFSDRLDVPKIK